MGYQSLGSPFYFNSRNTHCRIAFKTTDLTSLIFIKKDHGENLVRTKRINTNQQFSTNFIS